MVNTQRDAECGDQCWSWSSLLPPNTECTFTLTLPLVSAQQLMRHCSESITKQLLSKEGLHCFLSWTSFRFPHTSASETQPYWHSSFHDFQLEVPRVSVSLQVRAQVEAQRQGKVRPKFRNLWQGDKRNEGARQLHVPRDFLWPETSKGLLQSLLINPGNVF